MIKNIKDFFWMIGMFTLLFIMNVIDFFTDEK